MLSSPTVGQVANLRPIANRPAAGPGKFLGCGCQSSLNRVVLNITYNPAKLRVIAHQPVIALTLPERPLETQDSVAFEARESFEGLRHFGDFPQRGNEEMHVIRHYDVGVELVVSLLPKANCFTTMVAMLGMRRYSGPVHPRSRIRSMATKASPDVVACGKLRFAGRLPCSRQVRKMGWPMR